MVCVCPLMPLATPTILLCFLLPWSCGSSSWLLLTLDEVYLPTATPPDLECGVAPLGPPAPTQPLLLGYGVAPPGRRPWLQARGISSRPLLCHRSILGEG